MAEESGRPGTSRSKVGCEAIEEPCTNRIVPWVFPGSPATLFHRNSLTSPLLVQCSVPGRRTCRFIDSALSVHLDVVRLDQLGPAVDLGLDVGAELLRAHRHRIRPLPLPRLLDVGPHEDLVDLTV